MPIRKGENQQGGRAIGKGMGTWRGGREKTKVGQRGENKERSQHTGHCKGEA